MLDIELLCGHEGCLCVDLWSDGLCERHWRRQKRPKSATARPISAGQRKPAHLRKTTTYGCAVPGCPVIHVAARGWCGTHYMRWLTTGDPGPAELLRVDGTRPPRGLDLVLRGPARPACSLDTAHLFDPPGDDEPATARRARQWAAAQLCAGCPMGKQCRVLLPELVDTAPDTRGGHGVWAGMVVLVNGAREVTEHGQRRGTAPTSR